jgi:hypothetical protein
MQQKEEIIETQLEIMKVQQVLESEKEELESLL